MEGTRHRMGGPILLPNGMGANMLPRQMLLHNIVAATNDSMTSKSKVCAAIPR